MTAPSGGTAPRVSVIIPTCNRAPLLQRAIESVLGQTFRDFELIVVDDGSKDGTAAVLDSIRDSRLCIVALPERGGVARARNTAIARAHGAWLAFLDDDDEWRPEKLERQITRIDPDGDTFSVLYCDVDVEETPGTYAPKHDNYLPEGDVLTALLAGTIRLYPSTCLVKRDVLVACGGFDARFPRSSDTDLWLRLAAAGHRFAGLPEPLVVIHRDHGLANITGDPVTAAVAARMLGRRWSRLGRERLGEFEFRRRHRHSRRALARDHRKLLRRLLRRGDRREAWRYVRGMAPALPWGAPFVARAFLIAAFGRWPYRARRAVKALARGRSRRAVPEAFDEAPVGEPTK